VSPYGGRNIEETLSKILFDRYDTRDMYDNVTKESVKFVTYLMRRLPRYVGLKFVNYLYTLIPMLNCMLTIRVKYLCYNTVHLK